MLARFNIANTVLVGMAQAVSLRPERCNRMCHKSSTCNLCETNCPTQAIKVGMVGTKISVDWEKCSYCGICVNICPTGVFGIREMKYTSFLNTYLKKITEDGVLYMSCKELARLKKAEQQEDDPEISLQERTAPLKEGLLNLLGASKGPVIAECLGILGLPDILYFYTHGAREICVEFPASCTNCINKYGREIFEDELQELHKLAPHFEYLNGVTVETDGDIIKIIFPRQFEKNVLPEDEEKAAKRAEQVSRREVFNLLRKNATDTAVRSATLLTPQEIPNKTPFRTTKEIPVKRRIFLDSLLSCGKILNPEVPLGPYFFSQQIKEDNCKFCKICTRFCHSGALHRSEDDNQILFTAANCTSCGMCRISCYHKNIFTSNHLDLSTFFDEVLKSKKIEKTTKK